MPPVAMATAAAAHPEVDTLARSIVFVRGHKVILDADLATLYGVPTKQLNKAVKRNLARFPEDFMFRLTADEVAALRFQSGTSRGHGGRRYTPLAFTEQGVAMLSGVLSSPRAIAVTSASCVPSSGCGTCSRPMPISPTASNSSKPVCNAIRPRAENTSP